MQVAGAVAAGETKELAARIGLSRETLPVEVRKEEQLIGSRRRAFGESDDLFVAVVFFVECATGPAHSIAAGVDNRERCAPTNNSLDICNERIKHRFFGK